MYFKYILYNENICCVWQQIILYNLFFSQHTSALLQKDAIFISTHKFVGGVQTPGTGYNKQIFSLNLLYMKKSQLDKKYTYY